MGSRRRRTPRRKVPSGRFPLGELSTQRAALRAEQLSKSKTLNALRRKLKGLHEKIAKIQVTVDENTDTRGRTAFEVSSNISFLRKSNPTQLNVEGNIRLPSRSAYRRKLETILAATAIHGGTIENREPALNSMFSTLLKYGKMSDFNRYVSTPGKMRKAVIGKVKRDVKEYGKSRENFIRSVSLLYAGGILGKMKYEQARSAAVMKNSGKQTKKGYLSKKRIKCSLGIPIPKPLAYRPLMAKIDEIDLGELISIKETLCASLSEDQKIDGIYRKLENLVVMLSQFYFETDQFRQDTDKLVWFGGEEGEFRVAIGGDGAPFGKWDESMSWLVSFLNVGPRVASPNDNFLLFGANCKESHEVVALYTRQLKAEIEEIEKKCYMVAGKKATLKFDLVPSDMKFLAFVNGELNNAAKYFSSFATVSKDDCKELQWKFGTSADCHWKPWQYEDRIAVAKLVADKKNKLPAKLSKKTQRDRITKFIADQHSRQEFPPLIGRLCDKELVEPLHLRNNAVQHLHTMLLKLALTVSNLPAKLDSTSDISLNSAMGRYLVALENEVKAGRLKKQLVKWLLEDRSKDKDFSYRLTGKDSRLILHKFMHLVNAIRGTSNNPSLISQLLVIVFIAIKLRDCTAIFSRYHLPEAMLKELPSLARDYFTAVALFSNSVSVTTWSIGHLVPAHTRQVFDKYGTGLGINTMQGREAKHVQIASYAKQSLFKRRWLQVFKHDFISKLWLPCQQPSLLVYHPAKESLLPAQIFKDPQHYCYCCFAKEAVNAKCFYCGHVLMAEIKQSVAEGKLTKRCLSVVVS